jgi:hypothetical protein
MVRAVLALDVEAAKRIAIVIVAAAVILAILAAKFVKAVMVKSIVILALGVVVAVVFSQRAAIADCAKEVQERYTEGDTDETTCTFLGFDFTVKTPGGNLIRD